MLKMIITLSAACIFALTVLPAISLASTDLPVYNLDLKVSPTEQRLSGTALINLPSGKEFSIYTGALKINRVTLDGAQIKVTVENGVFKVPSGESLTIEYEAVYRGSAEVEDLENVGVVIEGAVSEEGISLTGLWYPTVGGTEGMALFNLKATLPEGYYAISEADAIQETPVDGGTEFTFSFPYPVSGITLAGGRYVLSSTRSGDVDIYAYFFEEDAELAATYLEYAVKYISMYEELLGPFPFKRFSVVENFQPTGYSMPTYTLLGRRVVRLPFIVETSLGHEIVHQWFGNSVYVDYESGNWSEGLTSYLSDHLYDVLKGEGPKHRKNLLLKYRGFVRSDNDFPLKSFFQRKDFASSAIGYGKSTMVFQMLREEAGEEVFFNSLRSLVKKHSFQRATWENIRQEFEAASGQDLGWFFSQWVERTGTLNFQAQNLRVLHLGGKYHIEFDIVQRGEPYRFTLPSYVLLEEKGLIEKPLAVEKAREHFNIETEERPVELVLDPGYGLMRTLMPDEAPPVIASLLGAKNRLAVLPTEDEQEETYKSLASLMKDQDFTIKSADEITDADLKESSVLIMGLDSPVLKRLFGHRPTEGGEEAPEGFLLVTLKNPFNPRLTVAGVHSSSPEETRTTSHKIFRYSTYSVLRFENGRNIEKAQTSSRAGMRYPLEHQVIGIAPSQALTLDDIIMRVIDTPVIFVGEGHPNYEDHKVQLRIIQTMHQEGRKFAVGMEMFQRPFQQSLDQYLAGDIDERQFLLDSEYYKRWKFNYHLYREILDYCRTNGIPVVALNQKAEIIRKISRQGFDALSDEERGEVPADMDMSDLDYRDRLLEVFNQHRGQQASSDFTNFYQAQVLWDETMAHSVAEYLEEHPDSQIVVVAGAGHIVFGSGIPERAKRLTGKEYVTLVPATSGSLGEPGIADYLYYAEPLIAPESPLIGVMLDKQEGRLTVTGVSPASPADNAGIKKGDIFISANGAEVKDLENLKVALFGIKPGESITLKMLRKRFILKDREMEFEVKF